jgi:ring-1,2-phenylacetyl-CoA epoxidase subunit PaaD
MVTGMVTPGLAETMRERVYRILGAVPDPEIPAISIVELGIVRDVREAPLAVLVTPTYTGCPATRVIEASIRQALDDAGLDGVAIEIVLSPPWTTDWISEAGRNALHAYGIAPPPMGADAQGLADSEPTICPQCASTDTEEVSRFGSTPCKALWRCLTCAEPFDRFKCH